MRLLSDVADWNPDSLLCELCSVVDVDVLLVLALLLKTPTPFNILLW